MTTKKEFTELATATFNATQRGLNIMAAKRLGFFGSTPESIVNGIKRYEEYKRDEIENDQQVIKRYMHGR